MRGFLMVCAVGVIAGASMQIGALGDYGSAPAWLIALQLCACALAGGLDSWGRP